MLLFKLFAVLFVANVGAYSVHWPRRERAGRSTDVLPQNPGGRGAPEVSNSHQQAGPLAGADHGVALGNKQGQQQSKDTKRPDVDRKGVTGGKMLLHLDGEHVGGGQTRSHTHNSGIGAAAQASDNRGAASRPAAAALQGHDNGRHRHGHNDHNHGHSHGHEHAQGNATNVTTAAAGDRGRAKKPPGSTPNGANNDDSADARKAGLGREHRHDNGTSGSGNAVGSHGTHGGPADSPPGKTGDGSNNGNVSGKARGRDHVQDHQQGHGRDGAPQDPGSQHSPPHRGDGDDSGRGVRGALGQNQTQTHGNRTSEARAHGGSDESRESPERHGSPSSGQSGGGDDSRLQHQHAGEEQGGGAVAVAQALGNHGNHEGPPSQQQSAAKGDQMGAGRERKQSQEDCNRGGGQNNGTGVGASGFGDQGGAGGTPDQHQDGHHIGGGYFDGNHGQDGQGGPTTVTVSAVHEETTTFTVPEVMNTPPAAVSDTPLPPPPAAASTTSTSETSAIATPTVPAPSPATSSFIFASANTDVLTITNVDGTPTSLVASIAPGQTYTPPISAPQAESQVLPPAASITPPTPSGPLTVDPGSLSSTIVFSLGAGGPAAPTAGPSGMVTITALGVGGSIVVPTTIVATVG